MLPSQYRIHAREFSSILKNGTMVQVSLFGLVYVQDKTQYPRFGFVVSNRISKKAHERNRAKRLLRNAVVGIIGKINGGVVSVILAKRKLLGASQREVSIQLESALSKMGVLK